MRILELCLSPNQGGLELYAGATATELACRGHEVTLLVADAGHLSRACPRALTFDHARHGWRGMFSSRRGFARLLDQHHIDVVHIHDRRDLPLAAFAKRWSRRRPRLIYSRHLHITSGKRDPYHRLLYGQVDLMLATTRAMQSDIVRFVPLAPRRVRYLPLGVAVNVDEDDVACARRALALPAGEFNIGAFSRLEYDKGQHVLVDAMARLRQEGLAANAWLVGNPAYDEVYVHDLRTRIEARGLTRHVRLWPFVDKPMAYMACFDMVAHTADKETFGLVILEAMAMGVAVIATNAGGVPEIVEDGVSGLLYSPGDSAQLTACIATLHRDPLLRERLASAGRARAAHDFSRSAHYDRLERIMRDAVGA